MHGHLDHYPRRVAHLHVWVELLQAGHTSLGPRLAYTLLPQVVLARQVLHTAPGTQHGRLAVLGKVCPNGIYGA